MLKTHCVTNVHASTQRCACCVLKLLSCPDICRVLPCVVVENDGTIKIHKRYIKYYQDIQIVQNVCHHMWIFVDWHQKMTVAPGDIWHILHVHEIKIEEDWSGHPRFKILFFVPLGLGTSQGTNPLGWVVKREEPGGYRYSQDSTGSQLDLTNKFSQPPVRYTLCKR